MGYVSFREGKMWANSVPFEESPFQAYRPPKARGENTNTVRQLEVAAQVAPWVLNQK